MANDLDPGPEARAVWTADTDIRRAMAHHKGHAHLNFDGWGAEVLRHIGPADPGAVWLEWGAGGGAVATAITNAAQPALYYAVDIDDLRDSECAKLANVRTLRPTETAAIPAASVDRLVSTACFQHFPSAEYGRAVLQEMRRLAAPGARGMIQIRYFMPGDQHDPATTQQLPYAMGYIRYMAWQIPEFWLELLDAGFVVERVVLDPDRPQAAWYTFSCT